MLWVGVILVALAFGAFFWWLAWLHDTPLRECSSESVQPPPETTSAFGVAETTLQPTGIVTVDDSRIHARSVGDTIGKGARVEVVGRSSFELLVREADPHA